MSKRYPNPRLVKIHRNYTVEEAADRLGKHKNTIRDWIKHGLPACQEKRPVLILGSELRRFLESKRTTSKRPCQPGEMYCLRCRKARMPAERMTDYVPTTAVMGKMVGLCPICGTLMNQRSSIDKVMRLRTLLDITIPQALRHIVDCDEPCLNRDLNKGT